MAQINAKQDLLPAADAGGTHARVGMITTSRRPGLAMGLLRYRDCRCAEWSCLKSILQDFVDDQSAGAPAPGAGTRRCVVACAGCLVGDRAVSENLPWDISPPFVAHATGVDHLDFINGSVAMAWGVQCVDAKDRYVVRNTCTPCPDGPVLVVGPGTGLGSGVFLRTPAGGHVLGTEAGHVALAPGNAREIAILENLARTRDYVSIGDVRSGSDLPNVYDAICRIDGHAAHLTIPAEITRASGDLRDASAKAAVQVFCGILGSSSVTLFLRMGQRVVLSSSEAFCRRSWSLAPRVRSPHVTSIKRACVRICRRSSVRSRAGTARRNGCCAVVPELAAKGQGKPYSGQ